MLSLRYTLRTLGGSARGRRSLGANTLAAFGLASTFIQFFGQLTPELLPDTEITVPAVFLACLGWGAARAAPRRRLVHEIPALRTRVSVAVGDLFEQDADIVVGFTDTFDTSVADDRVISTSTVQGQLVLRRYDGDPGPLDEDLDGALSRAVPTGRETRQSKPYGKLLRFPLGTVALISRAGQRVFAVAYSRMDPDNVARSSVQDLWSSLDRLWDAVYEAGQRRRLAMPVVGSGLARIDALSRESLLRMILLSFVARSRQALICDDLLIVIHPDDLAEIDLLEVAAFLKAV
ncbi:macro domain-containing protein [Actinomadura sp. 9N215]|uniref:macro domain-containing protein n=1 Tax=Actinomadura sp. 9N215 TaxID=3375150 RepID=UPI0037A846EF